MSNHKSDKSKRLHVANGYRQEAERQLKLKPLTNETENLSAEKILHELRVHQIELEMQNEELLHTQIALAIERDRYRDLFEFAPVGYFTLTKDGLILDVNFAGAEILGVERKLLISRPFSRYIAPEDSDMFYLRLRSLANEGSQQSYDIKIKSEDGATTYAHIDAINVLSENQIATLRFTLTNITENKRLEDSLRETKDYLDNLIEFSNGPIVVWDSACNVVKMNKSISELLGLVALEVIGMPVYKLFQADNSQILFKKIHDTLSGERWEGLELAARDVSGELRIISWNSATLFCENTGNVRAVIAQGQDITTRKQAENDLRIAAIAFQAQEGIFVTDISGIIIRANASFIKMTGYNHSELEGQSITILNVRQDCIQFFKDTFETVTQNGYWQGEVWNKRKDGNLFPGIMTLSPVMSEEGLSIKFVGTLLDISVQKRAENVLSKARLRLERQVQKVVNELNTLKGESAELNSAIRVMIKIRQSEDSEAKSLLTDELQKEVIPFLEKLKHGNKDLHQLSLINTLEANLQRLIATYGSPTTITSAYKNLTPKEIQVATMVREGFSTKVIASTLTMSPETVSIHRKNIRKKLGLDFRSDNLRSYLISSNNFKS